MKHIYKGYKTDFITSKSNLDVLYELNRESARVWNDVLELAKAYRLENDGKWISKSDLQKLTKGRYRLHSQSVQAVCHKYIFARDAALRARRKGLSDTRYPYKTKKNFNTKWGNKGFWIDGNIVCLSLGLRERKQQPPIKLRVKNLPQGKIKEIELIYDMGKLRLSISYDDLQEPIVNNFTETSAIDLGEIHSIASVSTNGKGVIITGRKARSIKRLRNKKMAELKRKMSKCKKGSRQWKKYRKALNYTRGKSERQLTDALHKTSKNYVDWCIEQSVKEVVVGEVEGVQRNTKGRRRKKTNQKLSQWQFGKLQKYLEYKLASQGISFKTREEAYTTQTCPVCGKRNKTSSRNYRCSCGYKEHRDIHGAKNILTKELYGEFRDLDVTEVTYLRIA